MKQATLALLVATALLGVVPQVVLAGGGGNSCPQTKSQAADLLGGESSDYNVLFTQGSTVVSWSMSSVEDERIHAPRVGRIDFGGPPRQYIFSSRNASGRWVDRHIWLDAFSYHCLGKRGASNGFPLSKIPRNPGMAARQMGGEASDWTRIAHSKSGGWIFSAPVNRVLKSVPRGFFDYASNGDAQRACKGVQPPPGKTGTWWNYGTC